MNASIAVITGFGIKVVVIDISLNVSKAEKRSGIHSLSEVTNIPEDPKNNPILRLLLRRQKGKGLSPVQQS